MALAILCYILTVLAVALSAVLIWYTSTKINWLLGAFIALICLLLLGTLIWYAVKFSFEVRNQKNISEKYESLCCFTHLEEPCTKKYFQSVLPSGEYKFTEGKEGGYRYEAYLKINEASALTNFLVIRTEKIMNVLFFDNIVNQIMLVHDVPAGSFKTCIIVITEKADRETKKVYQLNNPYNISHKKYYALFETKNRLLTVGGDKELISSDFTGSMVVELDKIFRIRDKEDHEPASK